MARFLLLTESTNGIWGGTIFGCAEIPYLTEYLACLSQDTKCQMYLPFIVTAKKGHLYGSKCPLEGTTTEQESLVDGQMVLLTIINSYPFFKAGSS